jgi:acyl-homoserine lactone acylase PvdQ
MRFVFARQAVLAGIILCVIAARGALAASLAPATDSGDAIERMEAMAGSVTIYRDTYGVPHIFGPTDASVVFGYMYARAEDRFFKFEPHYLRFIGRSAECTGA